MKILVISDTHYELDNLSKLLKKYPDMDLYLHAGDSERSPDELFPFQSVKGNRDYLSSFPKELVFNTPLGNLIMRHILQYSLNDLYEKNIKVVISGHTHKKDYRYHDGIYFINPGSLDYPRDGNRGSYAIVNIDVNQLQVKFHSIDDL